MLIRMISLIDNRVVPSRSEMGALANREPREAGWDRGGWVRSIMEDQLETVVIQESRAAGPDSGVS